MNRAQRDAVRDRMRNAPRGVLIQALDAVLDADAAAEKDKADGTDETAGWLADGTHTAAEAVWDVLTGGEVLTAGGPR